jgi:hypothetical protein
VEAAFKKVQFPDFNPHPTLVEKGVDDIKSFIKSAPVKSLHDALKDAKNLANEQAKEVKKNPLTKSTSKVLEENSEVGDYLMVACNPQSLAEMLKGAMTAWQKGQSDRDIRTAPATLAAGKKVVAKIGGEKSKIKNLLGAMKDDNDAEGRLSAANAIRDLCRDITQPLGNIIKVAKAGVGLKDFDQSAADALFKQMVPISNSKSSDEFSNGLSIAKMGALVKRVEGWADEFSRIFNPIEIISMPKV